jgi:heme A synthase
MRAADPELTVSVMNSNETSTAPADRRQATLGCLIGGASTIAAGLVAALLGVGTHVPHDLYRAPLPHDRYIVVSLLASITHVLVLLGILALRRSRAAGSARRVSAGLLAVAIGTGALTLLELADIGLVDAHNADSAAVAVASAFGLATLVTIVGLIVAGLGARSASTLRGWRRNALLICALGSLCVLPFTFTNEVWPGVMLLGAGYLVLGIAVRDRGAGRPPA